MYNFESLLINKFPREKLRCRDADLYEPFVSPKKVQKRLKTGGNNRLRVSELKKDFSSEHGILLWETYQYICHI